MSSFMMLFICCILCFLFFCFSHWYSYERDAKNLMNPFFITSTKNMSQQPELFDFDHLYLDSNISSPVAILYGALGTDCFKEFHQALAAAGKKVWCLLLYRVHHIVQQGPCNCYSSLHVCLGHWILEGKEVILMPQEGAGHFYKPKKLHGHANQCRQSISDCKSYLLYSSIDIRNMCKCSPISYKLITFGFTVSEIYYFLIC